MVKVFYSPFLTFAYLKTLTSDEIKRSLEEMHTETHGNLNVALSLPCIQTHLLSFDRERHL